MIDGDDDTKDLLTEDDSSEYSTIPGGLEEIKNKIQGIGDSLKELSNLSNSLEMISIIMDLANSAYALAIDVDDSIESYNEIMEVPEDEELDPDVEGEESANESKKVMSAKLNIANSILSVRKIEGLSVELREKFEEACKSLFE